MSFPCLQRLILADEFIPVQFPRGTFFETDHQQHIAPLLAFLLKHNGGIRGLVRLLSSNDDAAINQAVWGLMVACARDEKACKQVTVSMAWDAKPQFFS